MRAGDVPTQRLELRESNFQAMGCDCRIVALGGSEGLLELGANRVHELDDSWTRFRADSELSRFNDRAGKWTQVSADLMTLLQRGLAGVWLSDGLFNPFLANQMIEIGYDRDFDELDHVQDSIDETTNVKDKSTTSKPADIAANLQLDRSRNLARLQPGVAFDSGGIGKGLGADLVAFDLLRRGAAGALVSLGGDLRVAGAWPDDGWRISVRDPSSDDPTKVKLRDGSICTSGVLQRRWRRVDGSTAHHLLDPATGAPLPASKTVGVSVIARQGWRAEVYAKVAMVGGRAVAERLVRRHPETAILLWDALGGYSQVVA